MGGRVPVTEENKTRSYYKYYEQGVADPSPETIQYILGSKGTVEEGLSIHDRAKIQEAGCYPAKTGYYPLKEGGLLVASNLEAPDLTSDMMYWWFAWHCLDGFRYTIWDPDDHFGISLDDAGKKIVLDPNIPIDQKTWGATHRAYESLSSTEDPTYISLGMKEPATLGYDVSKVGTAGCMFLLSANTMLEEMHVPVHVSLLLKKVNGATQVHERFWIGYHIIDGEGKYLLPPEAQIPEEIAIALLMHNAKEYANLNKILPSLYEEESVKPLDYDLK